MDPRLLRLYEDELTHLREMGAEFARESPKIAARLGIEGLEVADPYVERLLEGFAFLAARVQLGLQAEHPRLIAQLLEALYPNALAPVPSMMVARLAVNIDDPNLAQGLEVPRGSVVVSEALRGQGSACEFSTAMPVTLGPMAVESVRHFSVAPDLPLARLRLPGDIKGGLRIGLRLGGGLDWSSQRLDRLRFFISAPDAVAWRLHELLNGAVLGSWVITDDERRESRLREAASVQPAGLAEDEALLPDTERVFSGIRLIQEFAALPQRLLFFELRDLAPRLAGLKGDRLELVIFFSRADAGLEALVDDSSLALHCTPAINLFRKTLNRIEPGPGHWEYHAMADRTRPQDFEIHHIERITGFGAGHAAQREFLPLYATRQDRLQADSGYFTTRRVPRLLGERERERNPRSSYIGDEVYVSLVDGRHGALREGISQLRVQAWVTQRDLPMLLPTASAGGSWRLDMPGPVSRVDALRGPTAPTSRRAGGDPGWRLVGHLTHNHIDLAGSDPQAAAMALRRQLSLHGPQDDKAWQRQVDGIRSLSVSSVVRRLPFAGPLTHGVGSAITLEVDDLAFQGASAFALACVLERYFARGSAINSFTQLTLRTAQRGEVMRWPPRSGTREIV
jgi:type VI secretion system protein ImpG